MTWPTITIDTTNLDEGNDSPALARPDIKQMADNVNAIKDEFNDGDGAKLANIEANANDYTHPATHSINEVTNLQSELDGKIDDSQVLTDVPSGAVFTDTDTIYTHPASHSINEVTNLQSELDGKIDDSQVLTDVPSGAVFTDTDTIYTHPSTDGNLHVPATSTTNDGKVLTAGATAGSLSWEEASGGAAKETVINTQTGIAYSPILSDSDAMIIMDNASDNIVTIPANTSTAYPIGTRMKFMQLGTGATTVEIATDTLNAPATLQPVLNGQYAVAEVIKINNTTWTLYGDLSLLLPFSASGGTEVDVDGYRYHTFLSNDILSVTSPGEVEYLVIAGGGGGGGNGGGGAGGYLSGTGRSVIAQDYAITVGAGGSSGTNGGISSFDTIIALGGGAGSYSASGSTGGSGGGAGIPGSGGSGTAGQGFNGGNYSNYGRTGGGGGAGGAATSSTQNYKGGNGGVGLNTHSVWATATSTGDSGYYAGGGAGRGDNSAGTSGSGFQAEGGGGRYNSSGQSGIVIVRYLIT
jgi:hypothetical protein